MGSGQAQKMGLGYEWMDLNAWVHDMNGCWNIVIYYLIVLITSNFIAAYYSISHYCLITVDCFKFHYYLLLHMMHIP